MYFSFFFLALSFRTGNRIVASCAISIHSSFLTTRGHGGHPLPEAYNMHWLRVGAILRDRLDHRYQLLLCPSCDHEELGAPNREPFGSVDPWEPSTLVLASRRTKASWIQLSIVRLLGGVELCFILSCFGNCTGFRRRQKHYVATQFFREFATILFHGNANPFYRPFAGNIS